jgi:hypothetical protein
MPGRKAAGQGGQRPHVHLDGGQLFGDRNILEPACATESGIVDQMVDGEPVAHRRVRDLVRGFTTGEVGRDDGDSHPSSSGSFGDGVQGIGVACNQDEIRAPLSQQVGERGADAARCAGDERGRSPEEITHGTAGNIRFAATRAHPV